MIEYTYMNRDVKKGRSEPLRAQKPQRQNTLETKKRPAAEESSAESQAPQTQDSAKPAPAPPRGGEARRKLHWRAAEYVFFEKNADWYWILGIIVVSLIFIAFLLGNFLFAIFTALAGFTIAVLSIREPETLDYEVNESGVKVAGDLYPYSTLDFFWIDEDGPVTVLIVESKKVTMRHIVIPLENINSNDLRIFLEEYIPEEFIERPFSQRLMERVGF